MILCVYVCDCALLLRLVFARQTLPDAVHQAHPDPERAARGCREEDLLPESSKGRASLLLQRMRRESLHPLHPAFLDEGQLYYQHYMSHCGCCHAGGGVQSAVCDQREQQQEELRGTLWGLCPCQEPDTGRGGGAGAVSDRGPDEDLRQLHTGQSLFLILYANSESTNDFSLYTSSVIAINCCYGIMSYCVSYVSDCWF